MIPDSFVPEGKLHAKSKKKEIINFILWYNTIKKVLAHFFVGKKPRNIFARTNKWISRYILITGEMY